MALEAIELAAMYHVKIIPNPITQVSACFLESEVDLRIKDQLLRLALGKETRQAFTPQTTQYQHCLQSIFHKGFQEGEGKKRGEKISLLNTSGEEKRRIPWECGKPFAGL